MEQADDGLYMFFNLLSRASTITNSKCISPGIIIIGFRLD